ncbi:MAG: glycosyltransferase family 2 protein [Ruminococcaceae bacterium]|nr:glycosyltransferase family 2 protein [Oscillospiraceae bacterium]
MENRILAIGIPSYNAAPYIDRCIPTFIHDKLVDRIEVIIVNDGSKDNTKELAEKYSKMYPDTVRVINKENGGHGSAVNAALYSTTAKYYKVVDVDDWVDTKNLIKLVDFLETCESDIVSSTYHTVDMITGLSQEVSNSNIEYGREYTLDELNVKNLYISIHSTTYKTKLLQEHNIRLQEKTFYVDVEYQLLPFPFVKTVTFLNDIVYKYMIGNVNQSVNVENFVRRYDDHNRVVHRVIEFLKTAEMNQWQKGYVYAVFEKVIYTHYCLGSVYDADIERGRGRSQIFDAFLKENNPELYRFVGSKYSNIKKLRKRDFVPLPKKRSLMGMIKLLLK